MNENIDGKYVRLPSGTRVRNLRTGEPLASGWTTDSEFVGTAKRAIVPSCEDQSIVWYWLYDSGGAEHCGFAVLASDLEVVGAAPEPAPEPEPDLVARIEAAGFEDGSSEALSACPEWKELATEYRRLRELVSAGVGRRFFKLDDNTVIVFPPGADLGTRYYPGRGASLCGAIWSLIPCNLPRDAKAISERDARRLLGRHFPEATN